MKTAAAKRKRKTAPKKSPQVVLKDGRPSAVILDIEEYREMLERLEEVDDLRVLEGMHKRPLKFRKLDDFLKGSNRGHWTGFSVTDRRYVML